MNGEGEGDALVRLGGRLLPGAGGDGGPVYTVSGIVG